MAFSSPRTNEGPPIEVVYPFPITYELREEVFLEPIFTLMYFLGFTYTEALNLPVVYKKWFIERVAKLMKGTSEDGEPGNGPTKDMRAQNDPMYAMARGKHRVQTPARLRRF